MPRPKPITSSNSAMNPALSTTIRAHYRDLHGYVSAGMEVSKNDRLIFMNANENPYELPGLEGFNRYPEPQPRRLLEAYGQAYQVAPDQIVATRGADEAIVLLTRLFCEPGLDSAVICPPTFGMYGVNTLAMPADLLGIPLLRRQGNFALDSDGIIQAIDDGRTKLVFLCSPNNPTATSFSQQELLRICQAALGKAVVVLDETYIEFSALPSMTRALAGYPNLVILRTLSKAYSMAGMRMGCLINADVEFIALVRSKCLDAYPLPHASVDAAVRALSTELRPIAQQHIRNLLSERERLREALIQYPFVRHVFPSDANFLLVEMTDASTFVTHCKHHDLILRDFSTKPLTQDCIRISIGTPAQNDRLIELLDSFSNSVG